MYTHNKSKSLARFLKQKAQDLEIEQQNVSLHDDTKPKELKTVRVFDTEQSEAIAEESGRSSNIRANHKRLLAHFSDTNGYLPLAELPESIFDDLDALSKRFPNFLPVIDFYKQEFALSRLTNNPKFSAQPSLILSPPGCGKTTFCHELAKIVDTHFEFISMSSMTAGFVLSGNSSRWSEGSYGKVVQSFAIGLRANPLLLIDETDKVGGDNRYDPLGSLYALLEKETAQKFVDEALEMPIDASHAVWVATANYFNRIPEPIVSRFTIIEVGPPSKEQMSMVLDSIYTKVRQNNQWGSLFKEELSQSVIDKLVNSELEPRLLQKILISACGRTVLKTGSVFDSKQDKLEISVDDLRINKLVKQTASKVQVNNVARNHSNEPDVVIMPIFNIPMPNNLKQEETMIMWSIYEIDDNEGKSHHLVGYIPQRQTGRVTSPIKQFEKELMRLTTSSGRIYKLDGPPALNGETVLVWLEWKEKYNVKDDIDVTHQYLTMH